jgi:hypothetical protein
MRTAPEKMTPNTWRWAILLLLGAARVVEKMGNGPSSSVPGKATYADEEQKRGSPYCDHHPRWYGWPSEPNY